MKHVRNVASLMLLTAVTLSFGCNQGGPARTAVKGTVKAPDGKPVDGGNLVFIPVTTEAAAPSAPATAAIKTDGTFEVTGGVVAGKHKVNFEAPHIPFNVEWDGKGTPPVAPKSPFAGMKVKTEEVEVKSGSPNDLAIELVAPGA